MTRQTAILYVALGLLAVLGGCQGSSSKDQPASSVNEDILAQQDEFSEDLERYSASAAVRGTIGEVCWIEGLRKMRVRGYGLVVGLGSNGSRTCPERVSKKLASSIRKNYHLGDSRVGLNDLTPEKMINSPDTAVVLVEGEIGAAALAGAKFDLGVQVLEGTEALSLEGGRLYTCELRYFRTATSGVVQEGSILAKGEGPLFINPFGQGQRAATPVNLRTGRVIGGGTNLKNRQTRLVMYSPSYALARRVQNRINDRYGLGRSIANAKSPSYVKVDIPERFFGAELEFLALIRHTHMAGEAGISDQCALQLADELLDADAPHDSIALAWETIGKTVKPVVRNLYTNPRDYVNFYAARTGLRLGDRLAVKVLQEHALDSNSMFQFQAIDELGNAIRVLGAVQALTKVVGSDTDLRARLRAYEGLLDQRSPVVRSQSLGGQFILDHIADVDGPPVVYAKMSDSPRLLVLGDPKCNTPMFYHHERGLLTMNADAGSDQISAARRTPSGRVSPPAECKPDARSLVELLGGRATENKYGQVVGLGMYYSQVVEVVADLCRDGTIKAEFRLEEPEDAVLRTEQRFRGRPEADL